MTAMVNTPVIIEMNLNESFSPLNLVFRGRENRETHINGCWRSILSTSQRLFSLQCSMLFFTGNVSARNMGFNVSDYRCNTLHTEEDKRRPKRSFVNRRHQ
jgi:hypothetical protein